MIMISSALNAVIPNVLTSRGEIAKASPATQAGSGETLSSGLPTISEDPCQVRQPSATGSSDSITGLAKLKEGSYPSRAAISRGEIIQKTSVSASSGTLRVGSRLPTVLDVTKATARLESAEDAGSILKMAAAPNAGTHTLDTMAEAKREISPQGRTVALIDPVSTGPSPVSQPEAAIVTKLREQSANSNVGETSPITPYKITPLPTLKTEIVASPPISTTEGHRPSPQDLGLLPECPEPKPKPPATAQGFTSSNGPENPGFKIPRGDTNSLRVQPSPIQGLGISPGGQPDPDLYLEGINGLLEPIAKSAAVARMASEIGPTLTLLATGSVDPHTQTTSEPVNRVGEDLPDLLQPPDHHKLQEGRPPDRTPLPHGDRPSSSSSTMPAGTPRLDLDSTNKIEPGRPSTRAQSGDSLEVTKEAQHHGFRPFQDLRYHNACPWASSSCSTDQAADATPMPPSRQLWYPTRQGHTLCLA
jgi:hypothetical protein